MSSLVFASGPWTALTAAAEAQLVCPVRVPPGVMGIGKAGRAKIWGKLTNAVAANTLTFAVFLGACDWGASRIYGLGQKVVADTNKTYTCVGPVQWQHNTAYTFAGIPQMVVNQGKAYVCAAAGDSAVAGSGPTGTGAGIVDGVGTLRWDYVSAAFVAGVTGPSGVGATFNDSGVVWAYSAAANPLATSEAILLENAGVADVPFELEIMMICLGATSLVMGRFASYGLETSAAPFGVARLFPASAPAAVSVDPNEENYLRIMVTPSAGTGSIQALMYVLEAL